MTKDQETPKPNQSTRNEWNHSIYLFLVSAMFCLKQCERPPTGTAQLMKPFNMHPFLGVCSTLQFAVWTLSHCNTSMNETFQLALILVSDLLCSALLLTVWTAFHCNTSACQERYGARLAAQSPFPACTLHRTHPALQHHCTTAAWSE